MIIGIDFDNTIITYDEILFRFAAERAWIPSDNPRNKKHIRDAIRALPDGETKWQRAQAFIYGPGVQQATLIEGVSPFLAQCHARNIPVYIVSHKTQFAAADPDGCDMRTAAFNWMLHHHITGHGGPIPQSRIFFEPTRAEKLQRIRTLRCTHFIDDLEETFLEADFPEEVARILYTPRESGNPPPHTICLQSWDQISRRLLGIQPHD